MAKLVTGLFLIYVTIIQFYSVFGFDNKTDNADLIEEGRLIIISSIIRSKCRAQLGTQSTVLPNVGVTLTRLTNGRLYYFSPAVAANRLNYEDARTFCREHGMHLVTINSAGENVLVYNKAVELGIAQVPRAAWIGYRDVTGAGNYQWTYPPKVGTPPNFFAVGQPVPAQCAGYTNTVLPAPPPAATSWLTYPCAETHFFICEMEPPCSLLL